MSAARSAATWSRSAPTATPCAPLDAELVAARRPAAGTAPCAAPRQPAPPWWAPRRRAPRSARRRARRRRARPAARVEQRLVAAPVDAERLAVGRRSRPPEVGDDVAAAEGVDRLLGVADQHHRRVPGERPVEHLPLHRVGVLELVDQHDLPALPHPRAGRGVRVVERVGELAEQVVVAEHAEPPLAPVHLGAHRAGEARPARAAGVGRLGGACGLERGLRVADRGRGRSRSASARVKTAGVAAPANPRR